MRKLSLLSLLLIVSLCQLKAQVIGARLKSLVNTTYIGGSYVPDDSTAYKYHGLMTSNMQTGVYNYDSAVMFIYNTGSYSKYKLYRKNFNASDSVTNFFEHDWDISSSSWIDYLTISSTFPPDSVLIDRTYDYATGGPADYKLWYEYDANGDNVAIHKTADKVYPAHDSIDRVLYTYNGSHAVTSIISQHYSHGGGFPPTPPGYINVSKTEYYYSTTGLDTAMLTYPWDATASLWGKGGNTQYHYDMSDRLVATYRSVFGAGVGFYNVDKDTMSYNSDNHIILSTNLSYDTAAHVYVNNRQFAWTYDTKWHDNPLTLNSYSWNGTTWAPLNGQDNQIRYHYEEYPDMVRTVNNAVSSFNMFPVPATTTLNIKMTWSHTEPFTVSIYDMQGRIIMKSVESPTINYQTAIPVSSLPAGNYTVRIKAADTDLSRQFNLVK